MPVTYKKIASVTVTAAGGQAEIEFANIPSTYDDLEIIHSTRLSSTDTYINITFNSNTSNYTNKWLQGSGSTTASGSNFNRFAGQTCYSSDTANTFGNGKIYIPNYDGSTNKSYTADSVSENNGTQALINFIAGLWSNTSAITNIKLVAGVGNFVQYSTATLYGISKS